nr:MAG TPA: telomere length regulation protein-like protein [Caudoviricetes sp.]
MRNYNIISYVITTHTHVYIRDCLKGSPFVF